MEINSAKFIRGIQPGQEFAPEKKFTQFAVVGRSNVGKSSFINSVTKHKNLCFSGSTPGVTQQANIFLLNKRTYLTDLPGYGYAKMPLKLKLDLQQMIIWYLGDSGIKFNRIFMVVDAVVGPTQHDFDMRDFLIDHEIPTTIIANKIDKLKQGQRAMALRNVQISFGTMKVIAYSSKTGEGRREVLQELS